MCCVGPWLPSICIKDSLQLDLSGATISPHDPLDFLCLHNDSILRQNNHGRLHLVTNAKLVNAG
jgi:hypothetical protein